MSSSAELRILDSDYSGPDWLNSTEAAAFLRIFRKKDGKPCVESLRNRVSRRKVPYYKPFGRLLFKRSELEKIIEASRKGTINGYK